MDEDRPWISVMYVTCQTRWDGGSWVCAATNPPQLPEAFKFQIYHSCGHETARVDAASLQLILFSFEWKVVNPEVPAL